MTDIATAVRPRHLPCQLARVLELRRRDRLRKRARRAELRRGTETYRIKATEYALIDMLIASGRIGEHAALDKSAVEVALAELVVELIERWRRAGRI
jgi:hypothetical protein